MLWILVWQVCVSLRNRSLLIPIPTPASTAAALIRLMTDQSFFRAVFLSIVRIAAGFSLAFAAGTALAAACVKWEILHVLFSPLINLIRAVPVASFTILIFLWISREKIPSTITFFTVLPIIFANVEKGLRARDAGLIELGRVFGMKRAQIFREIILPSIRPFFSSALANGIGFAWKSGVAAEVICRTSDSLGNLLWAGKSTLDYDAVFAYTFVIVLMSLLLQKAAEEILKRPAGHSRAMKPLSLSYGRRNASEKAFLLFDQVSFGYGLRKTILSGYNLKMEEGSRICLQGASGTGKTTVLRLAMGLLKPKSGTVRRTEGLSVSAVFQEDRLIPWKTVLENVLFFAPPGKDREERAVQLLEELGLEDSAPLFPSELSGGMRRRAALARALLHPFDLLVLDEAFTGLDQVTKELCLQAADRYASGHMLLMASHDPEEAAALRAETVKI